MASNTFKKAVTDLTTDKVVLVTMELSHPDWTENIYLVNNTTNITSNGQEYQAHGFSLTPAKSHDSGNPTAKVDVDDTDRTLNALFRSVTSEPTAVLNVILADNPDQIELGPYSFSVAQTSTAGPVITLALTVYTILNNNLTGFNMDKYYFPGLGLV